MLRHNEGLGTWSYPPNCIFSRYPRIASVSPLNLYASPGWGSKGLISLHLQMGSSHCSSESTATLNKILLLLLFLLWPSSLLLGLALAAVESSELKLLENLCSLLLLETGLRAIL